MCLRGWINYIVNEVDSYATQDTQTSIQTDMFKLSNFLDRNEDVCRKTPFGKSNKKGKREHEYLMWFMA